MRKPIAPKAWSRHQKRFFPLISLNFVTGQSQWAGAGLETPTLNDAIIIDYIGMKDKNKKRIYELDIIKKKWRGREVFGLVRYGYVDTSDGCGGCAEIPTMCYYLDWNNQSIPLPLSPKDEVIGNFLQTPDFDFINPPKT